MTIIPNGTLTSPGGFLAGATVAGIKKRGGLDLGILYSETPCAVAGRFTTNRIKAAPVIWCRECVSRGRSQAVVVNAGCANACTGEQGMIDTESMSRLAAGRLGLAPEDVLVASTGVIGERLPVDRVEAGVGRIELSIEGGHDLARAIMTTDTRPKEIAVAVDRFGFTVAGIAKGAGMIHPNMGTMLAFITTDAGIDVSFLDEALGDAVDATFNMVTIDGDTSTNDTVLLLANGVSRSVRPGTEEAGAFRSALAEVCTYLARSIAADGEGATRLIEIAVEGASSIADARIAARTIASSPLVKSAVHGCDPNWGRIVAALGRSGADFDCEAVDLFLGGIQLMKAGEPVAFDKKAASAAMGGDEISICVCLNAGSFKATAWGCDLSAEYVAINSEYTT